MKLIDLRAVSSNSTRNMHNALGGNIKRQKYVKFTINFFNVFIS